MSVVALTLQAFLALAARPECGASFGVDPATLASIAQGESGLDPLAINVNGPRGGSVRAASQDEAIKIATALITAGNSVDLGLMQINSANLARHGLTVATAFEPCASLRAGAAHFAADIDAVRRQAHCRYNTGRSDCSNGYPERISRIRQGIVRAMAGSPSASPAPAPTPAPPPRDDALHDAVRVRVINAPSDKDITP